MPTSHGATPQPTSAAAGPHSAEPTPAPRHLTGAEELKALAHPLRQRILARLRVQGPATSAELAVEFDMDRGATSYHLRQLARHGFCEVDQQRSAGRRKYWRAVPQDLRLPEPAELSDDAREVAGDLGRHWLESGLDQVARHWQERGTDPKWDAASLISTSVHRLTKDELAQFGEEYVALLKRWRRPPEDAPPDAEPVTLLFMSFRTPGSAL